MNKCKGPKEDYPTIWRDSKEMSMAGVRRTIWDEVGSVDHGRFCWSLKGLGFYSAVRRETIGSWLVVFFISLMTKDVEDFLMCLFDIWTSLVNVCSYLAYFLIWLFSYYSVLEVFFYICLLSCWLASRSKSHSLLWEAKLAWCYKTKNPIWR